MQVNYRKNVEIIGHKSDSVYHVLFLHQESMAAQFQFDGSVRESTRNGTGLHFCHLFFIQALIHTRFLRVIPIFNNKITDNNISAMYIFLT